jgi:GMP synthase-like glutamine amidotransferase
MQPDQRLGSTTLPRALDALLAPTRAALGRTHRQADQMSVRIAVLQHEVETGLGAFVDALSDADVEYEILQTTNGVALPDAASFDGALVLGGSLRADDDALLETRRWIRNAVLRQTPFLGVCLGGQLLARALGGSVESGLRPEVGLHDVYLTEAARHDALFAGLPPRLQVFGWHEDSISLPRGAVPLAGSTAYANQAFRWGASAYGLQFHLEVRPADLRQWEKVPGYARLLAAAGADWDTLTVDLEAAAPALDETMRTLIERWLLVVAGVAALRGRERISA